MNIDRSYIAGEVVSAPDLRFRPNGKTSTTVHVRILRRYRNASGEQQTVTTTIPVQVFGAMARTACEQLRVGSKVFFECHHKVSNEPGSLQLVADFIDFDSQPG